MRFLKLIIAGLFVVSPVAVNADLITSLSGDKDCFGLGGTCADGDQYFSDLGGSFFADNSDPSDPFGTDFWSTESITSSFPPSFDHTIDLLDAIVESAILEIFVAGPDIGTGLSAFLNGTFLGSYAETSPFNYAATVQFVVPIAAVLDGSNILSFSVDFNDGYIIDYTELRVTTAASVPEPGTLALLGIGLAGMGLSRRRKKA